MSKYEPWAERTRMRDMRTRGCSKRWMPTDASASEEGSMS